MAYFLRRRHPASFEVQAEFSGETMSLTVSGISMVKNLRVDRGSNAGAEWSEGCSICLFRRQQRGYVQPGNL